MSFWLPPSARWFLGPGVRRENEGLGKRGPGAAVVSLPQSGPQRGGYSAGTVFRFTPLFVSPAKAGAQEPRWCRCHRANLIAADFLLARCSSSLEKTAPSVPRRLWWSNVLLAAPSRARRSLGPGVRRENEG